MAKIIGGIAVSHTPTIGFAHDAGEQANPAWAPIFEAFAPLRAWLQRKKPEVLLFVYNDHVTSFFFDHYSAFALGVGPSWQVADEGGGARALPAIKGHPELAAHIGQSLMADEFDMAFFQDKALDHGCFSPLSMLCDHGDSWPLQLVPLQMGVLQFPLPSARRCWKLGQAIRRAVESFPQDLRVAIVATGGLSHQVHGERAGFNNPQWDRQFMDLVEHDPERLAGLTHAELAELGGFESAEVIMWLVMRGALSAQVHCSHRAYTLPSMTGIATMLFENRSSPPVAGEVMRQRQVAAQQLQGLEKLPGTYPFTLQRSIENYRLNRFLHSLVQPQARAAFLADEAEACRQAGLSEQECTMVLQRDWQSLIRHGAIFFVLEKLGAVVGISNLHIYAAMRGEGLQDFLLTRNAPGALYSVAAQPASQPGSSNAARATGGNAPSDPLHFP